MDRTNKYLEILKFKEQKFTRIKKIPLLKYFFLRFQNFLKKIKKTQIFLKKSFLNEIKEIMFGYGDSRYPNKNSIWFIEKLIINFVSIIVTKINLLSFIRLSKRPVFEDLLFIIRKDPSKTKRIVYLIKMKEIIEKLVKQTKNSSQVPKDIISKCKSKR
jgi:hypothetical protein